ncbi:hypothetical protein SAMN02745216_02920 [Desulfatibacillum alkenivorans DSM 16219]|uniref:PAS domain-containing protein n=1 Tax=Desulfatibacillum alkenivorans DSM 16219 TaxID=1121393 RepID=A0A1M6PVM8_9BACT|nr:hypothetical protein [Desulfatibacillum alkenivorans]SHK11962.1 hypothetical protein SAMN02745216_02920 [Desulfatibacillum alkenivorans DSM 16219]
MNNMEVEQEILDGFHLFWDNFPFPVMLNNKDRLIVDCNKAGKALGYAPGTYCYEQGGKEMHKGCLAGKAMKQQSAVRKVGMIDALGMVIDTYWIPLPGREDLFVHFGIDITEYVQNNQPEPVCLESQAC